MQHVSFILYTFQVAEKEGTYLAKKLNGQVKEDFEYKGIGMLAYIGEFKAVSELREFKDSGKCTYSKLYLL